MKSILMLFVGFLLGGGAVVAVMFSVGQRGTVDTRMELMVCAFAVQDHYKNHGSWPAVGPSFDENTARNLGVTPSIGRDEWGRAFICVGDPDKNELSLLTYGSDGRPGGSDGDIRVDVTPSQLVVRQEFHQ